MEEGRGQSADVNIHATWRLAAARRAARAYARNPKLAALAVAGSVGSGLADRFSDLELDCYWSSAPGDEDRTGPVHALGGELTALWPYDGDEEEWSEDFRLGDLDVTVSNFLAGTIERFLDDVTQRGDTDPVKHMRLAALQRSRPLLGADLMGSWRARAAEYPDKLVKAMVEKALDPQVLTGWAARDALASRGDNLALCCLLTRAGYAIVGAVLALNRIYLPHRQIKWQRDLLSGLGVAPERLPDRLQLLLSSPAAEALRVADGLLAETVMLAGDRTDADISAFHAVLSQRRPGVDPPPGAHVSLSAKG